MVMPDETPIEETVFEPDPPRPLPVEVTTAQDITIRAQPAVVNALAMAAYRAKLDGVTALTKDALFRVLVESEQLAAKEEYDRRHAAAEATARALMTKVR